MDNRMKITAVVLAGGRAQRMGGSDKGLLPLGGRPLIAWVLERVAPQVDQIMISANRNLEKYAAFGHSVVSDEIEGYAGPLAGLHRAMEQAAHPLVLCVPCDTPFLPRDLVRRLHAALDAAGAEAAVAEADGAAHPAVCLCRRELAANLGGFLAQGKRRMGEWQDGLKRVRVTFDDPRAFVNINRPEELAQVAVKVVVDPARK
jgi:molybdopterin-guanine dinucleotide biosynthesis protein A